ncbi:YdeI/OmpD-associated family protein [Polaribacter cellanae]|uniref:YdeI/OmpD-associated family protein n=1 Tax=Polaribacter cellanae TaxID=2818493 RepID=A0A975CQU7_9FLAO|nr:YdeI/OmpD-associated family protein [Polaribacter cellanae]QTE23824.1 YdeI/OmpD-associated family protein [Polaribacter cellanae]
MKTEKLKLTHVNPYNIFIPKSIFKPFADKKMSRVKVALIFNNIKLDFYAAVKKDKISGDYKMMISKQKQKELGLSLGDKFQMQLFEDTSKYGVEMPEELEAVLLSDYDAYQIFESLTAGKKRSIIYGVIRYKTSQQKIDKSLIMCENLKRGNHEPIKMFKLD